MDKAQQQVLEERGIIWQELSKGFAKQPKLTYYKSSGEAMPNLPADADSMRRYLARGFTLSPQPAVETLSQFTCETCGKVFEKKIALVGHLRSHKKINIGG